MVKLAVNPVSKTTTDYAAPLLKAAYSLAPALTISITARIMEKYFKNAYPIANTSGNVLSPVSYGSSISGGWQTLLAEKALPYLRNATVVISAVGIGLLFLTKK